VKSPGDVSKARLTKQKSGRKSILLLVRASGRSSLCRPALDQVSAHSTISPFGDPSVEQTVRSARGRDAQRGPRQLSLGRKAMPMPRQPAWASRWPVADAIVSAGARPSSRCQSEERSRLVSPVTSARDDAGDPTLVQSSRLRDHRSKRARLRPVRRRPETRWRRAPLQLPAAHGRTKRARRSQPDPSSCVFEPGRPPFPDRATRLRVPRQSDLAVHGRRVIAEIRGRARWAGKLIEHLVLDDRRRQIGDEKPLRRPLAVNENIIRSHHQSARRCSIFPGLALGAASRMRSQAPQGQARSARPRSQVPR